MKSYLLRLIFLTLGISLGSASLAAKTLLYCSEGSPEGFDPALYGTSTTFDASGFSVYSQLIRYKDGTSEIEPALAEKWEISDDGLEYTFHLRPNVAFHTTPYFKPTRTLTADDVIFSFNRQKNRNNPWFSYSPGVSYKYFSSSGLDTILKDIVKVDDLTVKFVLGEPYAPFLLETTASYLSILSKEYADQLEQANRKVDINLKPIGTGPFVFSSYQKDNFVRYESNKDFWGSKIKFDNLIFTITPDPSVRVQKLKSGECHIDGTPQVSIIQELKKDKNLQVIEKVAINLAYLTINTTKPPFDNVDVRRAVAMAIDRKAMVNALYNGSAEVGDNPFPPTVWSYKKDIEPIEYNPEKAKKLLEKAGVKNLEVDLWAMPIVRPYMPNAKRAAEFIQNDLAKVGIKAQIVSYEWGEYLAKLALNEKSRLAIMGYSGAGDPSEFVNLLSCKSASEGFNYSFWCDKEFDRLATEAIKITDISQRTKLYEKVQERFREELPWLPLAYAKIYKVTSSKVKGFKAQPIGGNRFENVELQ